MYDFNKMDTYQLKETINSCMVEGCNNKIPKKYPIFAKFCKQHTCTFSSDSILDFIGFDPSRRSKYYKSKDSIIKCYSNRLSQSVTTCINHTCKFKDCQTSLTSYSFSEYCKIHERKTTLLDFIIMMLFLILILMYLYKMAGVI
jgi:hypothetical protein